MYTVKQLRDILATMPDEMHVVVMVDDVEDEVLSVEVNPQQRVVEVRSEFFS